MIYNTTRIDKGPLRYANRRDLTYNLRDAYGLSALHRIKLKTIANELNEINNLSTFFLRCGNIKCAVKLRVIRRKLVRLALSVLKAGNPPAGKKSSRVRKTVAHFEKKQFQLL